MTLLNSMGLISTIALLLPIIMLLAFKLAWYKSFPALLFYYLFLLSNNFLSLSYIPVNNGSIILYHKIINHFLEVPLILFFYTYFSTTAKFRKRMLIATFGFIAFEIAVIALFGFTMRATTIILAPGLLAVLILSSLFFFHQAKIAIIHHKAIGKAILIASLLFAFSGYTFVYVVNHLVETPYTKDVYLLYFLITIVTSIPMAVGIIFEHQRVRHLVELQTTREELKKIYGEEEREKNGSLGTVALNYDKEQWN
jgi:hypothetical protein